MHRIPINRPAVLVAALLLIGISTGCDALVDRAFRVYRGPQPARESLIAETAIIRRVAMTDSGQIARLLLDRVRYLESGDVRDVNRVIEVYTIRVRTQIDSLDLKPGDRLVVSTEFAGINMKGELPVPDWLGHRYDEYPVGEHYLTSVARAAP